MKKRLFMFATAALMLAACSNDGEVAINDGAAQLQSGSGVVAFDTYTSSATKAGDPGVQTTATLQLADKGFGVFASHHGASYSVSVGPNFMYNEHVHFVDGAWTYSPLKYWPNETGTDRQSATSTDIEKLSFFAYAPYVSAGDGTEGITGLSANNNTEDYPYVTYGVSTNPANSVDLLWGVAPAGGLEYTNVANTTTSVEEGLPLIELLKPAKDQKIKFLFKHALSRIGFTVVGAFDQVTAGGSKDDNTKVTVKQIDVYGKDNIGISGRLYLKNSTANVANWSAITKQSSADPLFTISGDMLNTNIKDKGEVGFDAQATGVTSAEQDVLATPTNYWMVIPTGSTDITVKITYYVQTKDSKLAPTGAVDGSRIENVITKAVNVNLVNNKAYKLKLILGLTSVKLEAEVADWQVDGSTDIYLPQNAAE